MSGTSNVSNVQNSASETSKNKMSQKKIRNNLKFESGAISALAVN